MRSSWPEHELFIRRGQPGSTGPAATHFVAQNRNFEPTAA